MKIPKMLNLSLLPLCSIFLLTACGGSGPESADSTTSAATASTPIVPVDSGAGSSVTPTPVSPTVPVVSNKAPIINDAVFNIAENSKAGVTVGTDAGRDPDNDPLVYSIVASDSDHAFIVDSGTGTITVGANADLDAEVKDVYRLVILVSDGELSSEATVVITITDVNEPPLLPDRSFSLKEDTPINTPVGTLVGVDEDQDKLIYSIKSGNDNHSFVIDSSTGVISVNQQLDAETQDVYHLIVEVTDGEFKDTAKLSIEIADVPEPPSLDDITFSVNENSGKTEIGRLVGKDSDSKDLRYSIISGNADHVFTLDSESGVLRTNVNLDAEENDFYQLQVEVSDGVFTDSAEVNITINHINEAPSIEGDEFTLRSDANNDDQVGRLFASDPEQQELYFSILNEDGEGASVFFIEDGTGIIRVGDSSQLDIDNKEVYSLTVQVTDGELSSTANVTIQLRIVHDFRGKTPFILPLGDSITIGEGGPTYRRTLKELSFSDSGRAFDFVGTQFGPYVADNDRQSEGYSGYSTNDFLERVHDDSDSGERVLDYALARIDTPDIVLIHLGTNDMLLAFGSEDEQASEIERSMDSLRRIVGKLRDKNGNIVVLMAQIIPIWSTSGISNIVPYNKAIATLVSDLDTSSSPVVLVDQFSGFNPEPGTDMSDDGVHPSSQGDARMGSVWFDALEPFFDGQP